MAERSYSQCYLYSFDFDLSLDSYPLRISDTAVSCDELPYVEYEDVISNQGVLNKDVYAKEGEKTGVASYSCLIAYFCWCIHCECFKKAWSRKYDHHAKNISSYNSGTGE